MRTDSNKPGARAIRAFQKADRWAHTKPIDPVIDPALNRLKAQEALAEAHALMTAPAGLLRGGGEVAVPAGATEVLRPARNAILGTLEDPNMISVEASEQRLASLAKNAYTFRVCSHRVDRSRTA